MKPLLTKSNMFTIVVLIITSILTILWVNANAETVNLPLQPIQKNINANLNDFIGISLSKTCISQIKTNSTVTCPTYEQLINLGYDQSVIQSGKFTIKNNFFQRDYTKVRNEPIYYLHKSNLTIVDPSYLFSLKIKNIIIEPTLKAYLTNTDMSKLNNTRTVHKNFYTNQQCTLATMTSINWINNLPIIINHLRNNCSTELDTVDTIYDNATKTDIKSSQKYKEDKYKNESKIKYKNKSYIGSNDNSTNKSVTEDKDPKYMPPKTPPFDYSKYK